MRNRGHTRPPPAEEVGLHFLLRDGLAWPCKLADASDFPEPLDRTRHAGHGPRRRRFPGLLQKGDDGAYYRDQARISLVMRKLRARYEAVFAAAARSATDSTSGDAGGRQPPYIASSRGDLAAAGRRPEVLASLRPRRILQERALERRGRKWPADPRLVSRDRRRVGLRLVGRPGPVELEERRPQPGRRKRRRDLRSGYTGLLLLFSPERGRPSDRFGRPSRRDDRTRRQLRRERPQERPRRPCPHRNIRRCAERRPFFLRNSLLCSHLHYASLYRITLLESISRWHMLYMSAVPDEEVP